MAMTSFLVERGLPVSQTSQTVSGVLRRCFRDLYFSLRVQNRNSCLTVSHKSYRCVYLSEFHLKSAVNHELCYEAGRGKWPPSISCILIGRLDSTPMWATCYYNNNMAASESDHRVQKSPAAAQRPPHLKALEVFAARV